MSNKWVNPYSDNEPPLVIELKEDGSKAMTCSNNKDVACADTDQRPSGSERMSGEDALRRTFVLLPRHPLATKQGFDFYMNLYNHE